MSEKFAYVFPGQGAQFSGMGKDFFDNFEISKKTYDCADKVLGREISTLCFCGTDEQLKQTANSQPCIVATEIAMLEALQQKTTVKPVAVAGHSLGEYSAMYCAGVLNLQDTFLAIQKRANSMSKAVGGKMAAVLSSDIELINNCLNIAKGLGVVEIANYNSLKQVVITGENEAVDKAVELLLQNGVKRVVPLAVSGAFHSSLMKKYADEFELILNEITINDAKIPVYTNVDAFAETKSDNFVQKMPKQIYSSVYWTQTVQNMAKDGITSVVEIGPGQVLAGLIKKTVPEMKVYNVNDLQSLNETVKMLNEN